MTRALGLIAWAALLAGVYGWVVGYLFRGGLGPDYTYFMPRLLAGYYWFLHNGFAVPWFSPAFCAGLPYFADPQSMYYALPQLMTAVVDPLTSVSVSTWLFGLVGFGGMWLLASLYTRSTGILAFAAVAFALNDMYLWRMYAGHLTFQAFMLLPLVLYLLLRPTPLDVRRWLDAVLAGALLAYFVHAGAGVLVGPAGAVILVLLSTLGRRAEVWGRLGVALLCALLLAAGKLVATGYFMAQFPRDMYGLPGTASLPDSIELTLRSLVWPPDAAVLARLVVHRDFNIDPVEFNFAIGIVPVAVMVSCGIALLRKHGLPRPAWHWLVPTAVLCLPVAFDVYHPGWEALLKSLPYIGNSSTLFRWNLIYLLPALLLCVRWMDALPRMHGVFSWLAALAVLASVALYLPHGPRPFDAAPIVTAWVQANQHGRVPPVRTLHESLQDGQRVNLQGADNVLAQGGSQIVCNEPLFGYRLEDFRFDRVYRGPVFYRIDGDYNFYRPECFLFPAQNSCKKGDRFSIDETGDLLRLTNYQPYGFRMPALQRLADSASYIGLILLLAVAGARLYVAIRYRLEAGRAPLA